MSTAAHPHHGTASAAADTGPRSRRRVRAVLHAIAAGALAAAYTLICDHSPAHAQPPPGGCSEVEVIFARGTFEPPGVGALGQGFVTALQARTGAASVTVNPVDYPASLDFARAADGVADASHRIRDLATHCPHTQIVLGGYSQGAAVIAYLTADTVPAGYALPPGVTETLPKNLASHVSAIALFGTPSADFLAVIYNPAPPIVIGADYRPKTIILCAPSDPVCEPGGTDRAAHNAYLGNGMLDQAADFTAARLHTGR